MFAMARVLAYGAETHGEENWRKIHKKELINHALIHLYADIAGDTQDEHLEHALCRVAMAVAVKDAYLQDKHLETHNAGTIGGDIVRKAIQSLQRKVVYVAHPFQGKKENVESVEKYILNFVKKYPNYTFYSPLHATGFYYHEKSWEDGMKDCLEVLSRCDELWLCPGWENSKGCQTEIAWAQEHNMPIREVDKI
jgi:hypothetical protein